MKAAQLVRTDAGADGLVVTDLPVPRPADDELLVRVHAVCVSKLELEQTMAGVGLGKAVRLPRVLGMDPAGVVIAQGAAVDGNRVGRRVAVKPNLVCGACGYCQAGNESDCPDQRLLGVHRDGGAAEFVTVPARSAFDIADGVGFAAAAATVHSAAVAWHLLRAAGGVAATDTVLVLGAAGAVGSALVQLASRAGARVVGVVSSPAKADLVRSDGAAAVLLADRVGPDTEPATLVADATGDPALFSAAIDRLAWRGTAVTCAARAGARLDLDQGAFYRGRRRLLGVAGSDHDDVRAALEALRSGAFRPRVGARFPLAAAPAAYRALAGRVVAGKVVLEVESEDQHAN